MKKNAKKVAPRKPRKKAEPEFVEVDVHMSAQLLTQLAAHAKALGVPVSELMLQAIRDRIAAGQIAQALHALADAIYPPTPLESA